MIEPPLPQTRRKEFGKPLESDYRSANKTFWQIIRRNRGKKKMESWLYDVKKMKIPRPKFSGKYPLEPPKDYSSDDHSKEDKRTAAAVLTVRNIVKATEDLRRELQDKL